MSVPGLHHPAASLLLRLFQSANSLKEKCESYQASSCAPLHKAAPIPPPGNALPPYQLPPAPSITETLVGLGSDPTQTADISTRYDACCENLRIKSHTAVLHAFQQVQPLPGATRVMQKLVVDHELAYARGIERLKMVALSLVNDRLVAKTPFNYAFLPQLEAAFARNPRLSRQDRRALAERSGMSAKQISDWFQNHRTRSKKPEEMQRMFCATTVAADTTIHNPIVQNFLDMHDCSRTTNPSPFPIYFAAESHNAFMGTTARRDDYWSPALKTSIEFQMEAGERLQNPSNLSNSWDILDQSTTHEASTSHIWLPATRLPSFGSSQSVPGHQLSSFELFVPRTETNGPSTWLSQFHEATAGTCFL